MADHLDIAAVILAVDGRLDAPVEGKPVLRQVYDTVVGWGAAEPVVIVFSKQTEPLLSSIDLAESVAVVDEDGSGTGSALSVGLDALTRQTLENIRETLAADGMDFDDVVDVMVYVSDIRYFDAMNEVYAAVMPQPPPARATVGTELMTPDALVEIMMLAVR